MRAHHLRWAVVAIASGGSVFEPHGERSWASIFVAADAVDKLPHHRHARQETDDSEDHLGLEHNQHAGSRRKGGPKKKKDWRPTATNSTNETKQSLEGEKSSKLVRREASAPTPPPTLSLVGTVLTGAVEGNSEKKLDELTVENERLLEENKHLRDELIAHMSLENQRLRRENDAYQASRLADLNSENARLRAEGEKLHELVGAPTTPQGVVFGDVPAASHQGNSSSTISANTSAPAFTNASSAAPTSHGASAEAAARAEKARQRALEQQLRLHNLMDWQVLNPSQTNASCQEEHCKPVCLGEEQRLISGLLSVKQLAISNLKDDEQLRKIIRGIGLTPSHDSATLQLLYGDEAQHAIRDKSDGSQATGIFQSPGQLACLLVKTSTWKVKSLLEIGTWAGWTTALLSAYLDRISSSADLPSENITVHTVDTEQRRSRCVQRLHETLHITFHNADSRQISQLTALPQHFDLCFVDGDHFRSTLQSDLQALAGRCSTVVLANVVSRQVPADTRSLWAELKAQHTGRWDECISQPSGASETFGLGILHFSS
eukprot:TRINITY_DN27083_c0_g1_i1.p1 TRINITY_DN27083_c0_g1~~TRINITY_DN27083_c0_g1_i1.p1  ORF type:complete len:548 (-),score=97.22 TRINITY_DN27083_c0_g1_i1:60-1703(-)